MKYIIMCGGQYNGWNTPRQMTPIFGEPNIVRTIRLLRECGADDIAITSGNPQFEQFGVPVLDYDNSFISENGEAMRGSWVEAFYPSPEPACYIFGDVVFSPDAIHIIVETRTDSIEFFASCPPFRNKGYIKPYAEPFAFKVEDQARFRAAIDYVKANVDTGIFCRHPIAWELWQVIRGRDVREIDYGSYISINDYTCDIDRPADAARIEEAIKTWNT